MAGYMEYKDSGIPWLGDIPAHWGIERGKNILTLLDRPILADDEVITCFRDGEVTLRKNRREEGFTLSLQEVGYQGIEPGDLVVHGMDGFAGSIGVSDSRGKATPVLNVMDSPHNKRYLMYYLRMAAYKDVFLSLSTGIRVRSCDLRWNKLAVFPFVIPERTEQDAVVEYIDRELAKADVIIAEAKASIEEYKAWKASIIYEAVTKGVDRNVKMKDSGIEWIGKIPEHWKKCKIKQVADAYNGDRSSNYPSGDDIVAEGVPFITSNNLNAIVLSTQIERNKFITEEKYNSLHGAKLQLDDIVFCLRGSVGKCSINKQYNCGTIASSLVVFRAKNVHPDYLNYVLQNNVITEMALTSAIGIGSLNLSAENIMSFPIAIPPVEEQKKIAESLNAKCYAIELIISEKEALAADLEAYKKSLVFEVVTGKRKVV